jgi:hypothetical protein
MWCVFAGSLFLNATVSPALAGTGFGANDAAPTELMMLTVTVGPVDGFDVDPDGAAGEDELPPQPHMMMTAPATASAVPDRIEDRMLTSSRSYDV